jgi:thioesterase domain-containing protein
LFGKPTIAQLAKLLEKPTSSQSTALVPLAITGSEQPLFCIHPAGGTVFCYHELANCFAGRRPVFGLQARGVDGLEKPHLTVPEMARHYAAAIRAAVRQGPVHLVGWSLGGNIAFEVACQLAKSGREIGVLALLDAGVFASEQDWSEQDFLPLIAALFPEQQHASLEELRQATPEEQLAYFIRQAARAGIVPEDPVETGTHIFDVFQSNVKAVHEHQPQPYNGSMLLVRPNNQIKTNALFDDQLLGWDMYAARIELARVSGDHAHMLQRPAVLEIAAELEKRLSHYSAARRNGRMVMRS